MYRKSNRKPVVADSFLPFPLYFYFRLGLKCLSGTVFRRYSTCNIRRSLVDSGHPEDRLTSEFSTSSLAKPEVIL